LDNLRLILIIVGLLILAAIVVLHRPRDQGRRNRFRWLKKENESEPDEGTETDAANSGEKVEPILRQASFPSFTAEGKPSANTLGSSAASDAASNQPAPGQAGPRNVPDKIVSLFVRRRDNRRINGSELLDAAIKAGLTFGEMNIFHRINEGYERPVFSMANLTPPGHFDASAWNVFDTPGVALFVTLPAPVTALDAWDAMLATGRRISELLDAELLDDAKCLLTRQRIAQIREEMRDYDRRHGLGGNS